MPRHTRTQRQRRLDAYKQREREQELTKLAGELRTLWRQYEAEGNSADRDGGYVDSKLVTGNWGVR